MSNDALQILPEADAFVDDVTLSKTYHPDQEDAAIKQMEGRLVLLQKWGNLWQIAFAAHKSQLMIIWRSPVMKYLRFGSQVLASTGEIEILGVTYDKALTFHKHIVKISKKAAGKIAALRRLTWLVDKQDLATLYKAQVRSCMEFSPLSWGGAAPTHLALLDKVQRRAERLIYGDEESTLQPLQARRDVAGMTVMFKIHVQNVDHLQELRQPARVVPWLTRQAARSAHSLAQPRCNTLHHQRQFVAEYTRKWNSFMENEANIQNWSLQVFKITVNRWLLPPG